MVHARNISATAREINVGRKPEWVKNEERAETKRKQTKKEKDFNDNKDLPLQKIFKSVRMFKFICVFMFTLRKFSQLELLVELSNITNFIANGNQKAL